MEKIGSRYQGNFLKIEVGRGIEGPSPLREVGGCADRFLSLVDNTGWLSWQSQCGTIFIRAEEQSRVGELGRGRKNRHPLLYNKTKLTL